VQKIKVSRKKYFNVKIPNAMFEVGLTAYCIAVYVHLKRVTQDEDCCKLSMLEMSRSCSMSETTFRKCLKILSTTNKYLKQPLITIVPRVTSGGKKNTNSIYINEI